MEVCVFFTKLQFRDLDIMTKLSLFNYRQRLYSLYFNHLTCGQSGKKRKFYGRSNKG